MDPLMIIDIDIELQRIKDFFKHRKMSRGSADKIIDEENRTIIIKHLIEFGNGNILESFVYELSMVKKS
jgi:hypothetical protein